MFELLVNLLTTKRSSSIIDSGDDTHSEIAYSSLFTCSMTDEDICPTNDLFQNYFQSLLFSHQKNLF